MRATGGCGVSVPILSSVSDIRDWYHDLHGEHPARVSYVTPGSREVSWTAAFERLHPVIERMARHGQFPLIGTPEWADLPDGDPRLIGSVYYAAEMHALHLSVRAHAMADASREVSTALPWAARYRDGQQRQAWLETNPWAKRVVA
ncbi:DUF2742 domain-containing protein [Gordonia westfalica]|uniref:DUF2742 domain-containing protein n=1 Tax=Gordonia westfalica TaxID=158898 RepID=A0ABU2GV01_9ACTN|nr:DUF2742 domain-containing protein [Gordonia westfalica]MDS1115299.1 DUF2742 domain-containing protein [Gordonia westfalica]